MNVCQRNMTHFGHVECSFITRNATLAFQHIEVLELRSVIFVTKIHVPKLRLKWTINVFPHTYL